MSKLDDMIEAQARAMANAWPKDQHEVVVHDLTLMATFLRTDTAFRAMCEERLERLEAEWESAREDMWQDHKNGERVSGAYAHKIEDQISALRTLLEG